MWEKLEEPVADGLRVRIKKGWGIDDLVGFSGLLEGPKMLRSVFAESVRGGAGTRVQGSGLKIRIPAPGSVLG